MKSSGYTAEYGGAMGGVINAVTKSGTNDYHGSGLLYWQGTDERRPVAGVRLASLAVTTPAQQTLRNSLTDSNGGIHHVSGGQLEPRASPASRSAVRLPRTRRGSSAPTSRR